MTGLYSKDLTSQNSIICKDNSKGMALSKPFKYH